MGHWVVSCDNWKYFPDERAIKFKMLYRSNYRKLHGKCVRREIQIRKARRERLLSEKRIKHIKML